MKILYKSSRPTFIVFPEEDHPDAKDFQYCWMWKVQKGKEDPTFSKEKKGIHVYYADSKTRGGGTFPLKWRSKTHYRLPADVSFPLSEAEKEKIVDFVNEKQFKGKGFELPLFCTHEIRYMKNVDGFEMFKIRYPEFTPISQKTIEYYYEHENSALI